MHLKSSDQMISGDLSKCWSDYAEECDYITSDYAATDEQIRFMLNHFIADAYCTFFDNAKPFNNSYNNAMGIMDK